MRMDSRESDVKFTDAGNPRGVYLFGGDVCHFITIGENVLQKTINSHTECSDNSNIDMTDGPLFFERSSRLLYCTVQYRRGTSGCR